MLIRLSLHLMTLADEHIFVSKASFGRATLANMVIEIVGTSPTSLYSDAHDMISTSNHHA